MRKIGLSELNLEQCIYMSVGSHVSDMDSGENESLEQIILRKSKEVEECGWSLWGYATDRKLRKFCEEYQVRYAVMIPTGKEVKSDSKQAREYIVDDKVYNIPDEIRVKYAKNRNYNQALCVEEYFFVDENDNNFIKSDYYVPEGYIGIRDIWPLVRKKEVTDKKMVYPAIMVAKLREPYSMVVR